MRWAFGRQVTLSAWADELAPAVRLSGVVGCEEGERYLVGDEALRLPPSVQHVEIVDQRSPHRRCGWGFNDTSTFADLTILLAQSSGRRMRLEALVGGGAVHRVEGLVLSDISGARFLPDHPSPVGAKRLIEILADASEASHDDLGFPFVLYECEGG